MLQAEESRDLFILKELRHGAENKPLIYNSYLSGTFGREITTRPARALRVKPPFDGFHFIDLDPAKANHLRKLCEGRQGVEVHTDDANQCLKTVLPTIRYSDYKRALCLLDPYGLHLDWEIRQIAGQLGTIDMFLNFPIMDMNRNTLLWKPELADPEDVARITRFWGDESWKQVAWSQSKQPDMFRDTEQEKQPNKVIAEAFRERLKNVAGFAYVAEPLPMTNKKNAVLYYLFFAAKNPAAGNIIESIFQRARKGAYRTR